MHAIKYNVKSTKDPVIIIIALKKKKTITKNK